MNDQTRSHGSAVVGYVRSAIHNDPQLDVHAADIDQYAADHGLYLASVIRDEGTSAVAAWRPVVDALIRDLDQGRYAGVIVASLEQLGRPRSAALRVLARMRATSAWVAFVDATDVPDDDRG